MYTQEHEGVKLLDGKYAYLCVNAKCLKKVKVNATDLLLSENCMTFL